MPMSEKEKFRARKEWQEFRKEMRKGCKVDAITGKPLAKNFNLHHCDFNEEHYENLNPENFLCLNNMSHDVIHFIYGAPGRFKDWRNILKKLEELCILHDKVNGIAGDNTNVPKISEISRIFLG